MLRGTWILSKMFVITLPPPTKKRKTRTNRKVRKLSHSSSLRDKKKVSNFCQNAHFFCQIFENRSNFQNKKIRTNIEVLIQPFTAKIQKYLPPGLMYKISAFLPNVLYFCTLHVFHNKPRLFSKTSFLDWSFR